MGLFQLPLQFSVLIKSLWQKPPVVQSPPPNAAATGTTITTISNKSNCSVCSYRYENSCSNKQTRQKPKMPSLDRVRTFRNGFWLLVSKITIAKLLFSQRIAGVCCEIFEVNKGCHRMIYWSFRI